MRTFISTDSLLGRHLVELKAVLQGLSDGRKHQLKDKSHAAAGKPRLPRAMGIVDGVYLDSVCDTQRKPKE
jgi:hypothetical protein